MNMKRGLLMLIAAAIALWRGWRIHHGTYAWLAYGLAAMAIGLAVWHLTRESGRRPTSDARRRKVDTD